MARLMPPAVRANVVETGRIICRVDVYDVAHGDLLLTSSPENPNDPRMKIINGSITTDAARTVVGTGSAKILVDEETAAAVVPLVGTDVLSPTAPARIHVLFHAPGDPQLGRYGVYEVENALVNYSEKGVELDVEVSDNSRRVERARFWRPTKIPNKTAYATAFHTLLDSILPEADIDIAPTKARTGLLEFDMQADRLSAVNEMATAIGFRIEWNADGRGNVDIVPDSDPEDDPVWLFVDESAGGNARVVRAGRTLTDERTYNGVIAMGESAGSDKPPVRAEIWDTNKNSPTYFNPADPDESAYGPVPFFYVSQFITTAKQAQAAARARLPKVLGLVEVLTIDAVPNPGVVPGDIIEVEAPLIGVSGRFIVESTTLPLTGSAGRMTIVCRERRIIE